MIPVRRYWRLLAEYLRPHRLRVVALAVLLLTSIALQLVNPQLIARFLDGAAAGEAPGRLVRLAVVFMGLAVLQQVLGVAAAWVAEQVGWSATNQLRSHLTSHCVDLDMGFHKTRTPGELLERIDGDVTALFNFFSQFAIHVVGNAALLVGWWWRSSWRTCGWAWGSPPDRSSS